MKRFVQISHTADLAAKVYGKSKEELFENAAYAMFSMMADIEKIKGKETVSISVDAPDEESLLIKWLNELLYVSFEKQLLLGNFQIKQFDGKKLSAEVSGEKIENAKSRLRREIKSATYHAVEIEKTTKGYGVTIVFDV